MNVKNLTRIATTSFVLITSVLIIGMAQSGPERQGTNPSMYSQEARDAVQDNEILQLQEWRKTEVDLMQNVRDNEYLHTGAIIGFGAVLTYLQIAQMRRTKEKEE